MTAAIVLLTAVTAILTVLVVGLLRSQTAILKRLADLSAGADNGYATGSSMSHERQSGGGAPDIVGLTPGGDAVSVRVGGSERDTIVAFLSSGCITCQHFWDAFKIPRKLGLPDGTRLVVVTKGTEAESASAVAQLAPSAVPTIMSSQAFDDYHVPGSPYFIRVHGPTGQVRGEGTAANWGQVLALLGQTTSDSGND